MATIPNLNNRELYCVIHPLNDVPEEKRSSENIGLMEMTLVVRGSLYLLRGYLLFISGMLLYRVAEMAGVLHHLR